jgi:hypothetical protein
MCCALISRNSSRTSSESMLWLRTLASVRRASSSWPLLISLFEFIQSRGFTDNVCEASYHLGLSGRNGMPATRTKQGTSCKPARGDMVVRLVKLASPNMRTKRNAPCGLALCGSSTSYEIQKLAQIRPWPRTCSGTDVVCSIVAAEKDIRQTIRHNDYLLLTSRRLPY